MRRETRTLRPETVEKLCAELALNSHGVVARQKLLEAGISSQVIQRRIERGSLLPIHRGIYGVGHMAPSREARYLAAVMACGPSALLAGRAAAHLWKLIRGAPPSPEVISLADKRVKGVLVHRTRRLDPRDADRRLGVPATTVPRTLVDLAPYLPPAQLARACHEAGVLYRLTPNQAAAVLARRPTSRGATTLRRILYGHEPVTLSALESRFLTRLKKAGLPLPQTNKPAGGRRVDCRWPERCLTVELDSYRYHSSRHAWELDRRREREARGRGDEFRRFTHGDVFEHPAPMLRELAALLRLGSGT